MTKTQLRQIAERLRVTEYPDYRAFLMALYTEAKRIDPSYSYALLSTDLGLGSTNAHGIINGRRPLTEKSGRKIAEALHLTGVDKRWFLAVIRQTRARSNPERDAAFAERLELKRKALPSELSRSQLEFFANWYNAAILELLRLDEAHDDPEWIASTLTPSVPVVDIRASLELLQSLGYLAKSKSHGRLFPTAATITSGNEVRGLALASYHRQMIGLAVRALDDIPQAHRDISAVTVTASPELLAKMKDEIVSLRKRLLAMAAEEGGKSGAICQLNIQLFPLVKPKGRAS